MTTALGLATLLAVLPGSWAQAGQRAELSITGTSPAPGQRATPAAPGSGAASAGPPAPLRRHRVRRRRLRFGETVRGRPAPLGVRSAPSAGRRSGPRSPRHPAHAAGDPAVTIADFHFSPRATTVRVGDTITWINSGPSSHSATATNGGFDTGILRRGQSASHTFAAAGTFTYYCRIHPFMHGTIVVLTGTPTTTRPTPPPAPAAAPTTTTGGAAGAGTPASPSTSTPPPRGTGGPTLPLTGLDVFAGLAAGLLLIGVGMAVRRSVAQ